MVHVYVCIKCGVEWTDSDEDSSKLRHMKRLHMDKPQEDKSGGVCPECYRGPLKGVIERHQNKCYGHSCFLKVDECSNSECGFKTACKNSTYEQWKKRIAM